jgi:hypothetical protein
MPEPMVDWWFAKFPENHRKTHPSSIQPGKKEDKW